MCTMYSLRLILASSRLRRSKRSWLTGWMKLLLRQTRGLGWELLYALWGLKRTAWQCTSSTSLIYVLCGYCCIENQSKGVASIDNVVQHLADHTRVRSLHNFISMADESVPELVEDVWLKIFGLLNTRDLIVSCMRVSREWRQRSKVATSIILDIEISLPCEWLFCQVSSQLAHHLNSRHSQEFRSYGQTQDLQMRSLPQAFASVHTADQSRMWFKPQSSLH